MNGPPQKPTSAFSVGRAAHRPDGLEHRCKRRLVERLQALDVTATANRLVDHGAHAFDEARRPPSRHRGHDVREENCRVDVVPTNRLERHLRAGSGVSASSKNEVPLAKRAILR